MNVIYTGVFKRGSTWKWDVSVKGQRRYGYCKTEQEAVIARQKAKEQLTGLNTNNLTTLSDIIELLLDTDWSKENCKSHNWFKNNAEKIMIWFKKNRPISEIQNTEIMSYVLYMKRQGKSNGTINRKLALLSKIMRKAQELGLIIQAPIIHKLRENQGRLRYLSVDEENTMLEYLKQEKDLTAYYAVIVLIDTGIRTGELQKLTFENVDYIAGKNGTITLLDTKNGENRSVPLTFRAKSALVALESLSKDDRHYVPQTPQWLRYTWERVKKHMQLENDTEFVPHCLRHTCASRLVQRGAPLYVVAKWLGHKTLVTTKRYAHLRPDDLFEISALLEQS